MVRSLARFAPRDFHLTEAVEAERQQQIACTKMLRTVLRPDVAWTAIDHSQSWNPTIGRNGQPIGMLEMAKRKAMGVRAGIPDYLFWYQGLGYAIEFKIGDGKLNADQKVFCKELIAAAVHTKVAWGEVQVMNVVWEWGLCRPEVHWEVRA